jgi:hypothetical protein
VTDPLAPLLELDGVAEAVQAAREAVDAVHRHPTNRRGWPATAAEASVRAARASAAIDGGDAEIPADGEVREPVLAGALRVGEALGPLLSTWQRAPLQALARMHVLAAADLVDDPDRLGRPRPDDAVARRLELLGDLITGGSDAPGPVLAAVVHGELLALQAFGSADGVVARAAARATVIATGLDPKGLAVPEVACFRRLADYRAAADGFAAGTPDGLREWLLFHCETLEAGAREAAGIADAAAEGGAR